MRLMSQWWLFALLQQLPQRNSICPISPSLCSSSSPPPPCRLMLLGSKRRSQLMKAQWRKWSWPLRKGHTKTRSCGSSFLTILRSKHALPLFFTFFFFKENFINFVSKPGSWSQSWIWTTSSRKCTWSPPCRTCTTCWWSSMLSTRCWAFSAMRTRISFTRILTHKLLYVSSVGVRYVENCYASEI